MLHTVLLIRDHKETVSLIRKILNNIALNNCDSSKFEIIS